MNLILAAGLSTRLDGCCKALVEVGGRPMIDWQLDALPVGDTTLVVRTEHVEDLLPWMDRVDVVVYDELGGPGKTLAAALPYVAGDGPLVVAYGDTWWESTPAGHDWIGVTGNAHLPVPGRAWDVIDFPKVVSRMVAPGESAQVCVGLYAFSSCSDLIDAARRAAWTAGDVGMPHVLAHYHHPMVTKTISEWQDTGDLAAINNWRATCRSSESRAVGSGGTQGRCIRRGLGR